MKGLTRIIGLILSVIIVISVFTIATMIKVSMAQSGLYTVYTENFENSIIGSDGAYEGLVDVPPYIPLKGTVIQDGEGDRVYSLDSAFQEEVGDLPEGPYAQIGHIPFSNGEISMRIVNLQDEQPPYQVSYALIYFRIVELDLTNYDTATAYGLTIDNNTVGLYKGVNGEVVIEEEVVSPIEGDEYYDLTISADDGFITVSINGEVLISITDPDPIPEGKIWIGTDAGITCFDDIVVASTIPDTDGDGIADNVDELPLQSSNGFSDGETDGIRLNLDPGITIWITDAPDPAEGIRVVVMGPPDGTASVNIIADSGGALRLPPGEYIFTTSPEDNRTCLNIRSKKGDRDVELEASLSAAAYVYEEEGIYCMRPGTMTFGVDNGGRARTEYLIGLRPVIMVVETGVTVKLYESLAEGELLEVIAYTLMGTVTVDDLDVPQGQNLTLREDDTILGLTISIDIKPGSEPNCFNNNGQGVIPVAILGSANFNVTTVDPSTCLLKGLEVKIAGKSNKYLAHIEDVNEDGFDDLVLQMEDQDGVFSVGASSATLNGYLYDGTFISGVDSITIVQ